MHRGFEFLMELPIFASELRKSPRNSPGTVPLLRGESLDHERLLQLEF